MTQHTPPPEPAGGQDTDPPDLRLAVNATITLLTDLRARGGLDDDIGMRILALRAAMIRLRDHLDDKKRGRWRSWWRRLVKRR